MSMWDSVGGELAIHPGYEVAVKPFVVAVAGWL